MTYRSLREKIRAEKEARLQRYSNYDALYRKASEEGMKAGMEAVPVPMVVYEPSDPLNEASPPLREYFVKEGPCGFAEVIVHPGTSSFARWLVKNDLASPHYRGGVSIWIGAHNQSVSRKEAHAYKMAEILKEAGITCYVSSRLD